MSTTQEYLAGEYAKALRKLAEVAESERQVRALLQRADERRLSDKGDERRWGRIVARLEIALDYAKAMQAHWEGEALRQRRRAEKNGAAPGDLDAIAADAAQAAEAAAEPEPSLDAAQATLRELHEEDHEALAEIVQEVHESIKRPEPTLPPKRPAVVPKRPAYPSIAERRRMRCLRQAVDKLLGGHFELLTLREIETVFEARELWNLPHTDEGMARQLREALGAFCSKTLERIGEWERQINPSS